MNSDPVIPLYGQVKGYVIDAIERGEFHPGDQIPSQRELCARFNISLMTARRAINELISEGMIFAIHGKGLFVAAKKELAETGPLVSFSEDMLQRGMIPSSHLLESSLIPGSPFLTHILGIEPDSEVVQIKRLRLADNRPIAIQTNFVVHRYCPALLSHNLENVSLFHILRFHYGLRLHDTRTTVESTLASEAEGQLLDIPLPASLLITEQLTFLENGQAIEFARTHYRGDRYHIKLPARH
jgi:GntR family transcriptional regulator